MNHTTYEHQMLSAGEGFQWAATRAFNLGMQSSTGGNISIRVAPDLILTKPSGLGLVDCQISDLILVDAVGVVIRGGLAPTKELAVHLGLFNARPDIGGIAHYHAPYATSFAAMNMELPLITIHAERILKKVPLVEKLPEGSLQLRDAVSEAFQNGDVKGALLAGHGIITAGANIQKAHYYAELIEETARIAWLANSLNRTAP